MEYSNLPDIGGLAALRAVVERGGVTEAARALHVGQPAVTKRLRTLEHTYGVALVQRAGGRLRLTNAGEKVYALAVQTLDRAASVREELQRRKQGRTSMRLVVSHTIGEHFLSELLLQFAEAHADYRVHSRVAYSRQIQADLATTPRTSPCSRPRRIIRTWWCRNGSTTRSGWCAGTNTRWPGPT